MNRYSDTATERRRRRNYERWQEKAKNKHGDHFDYSHSAANYRTQKSPAIKVVCSAHGEFSVTPHDHLRFAGGGCRSCGLSIRGAAKKKPHAAAFDEFFRKNLSDQLELLSEYRGIKESVRVRCRRHGTETQTIPDRLLHGAIGCPDCIAEQTRDRLTLKIDDVRAEFDGKFPDHIEISELRFDGKQSRIKVECERHGARWVSKGYLTKSLHGCPKCGKEVAGYAGYRLKQLVETGDRGREAWVGVMEVEVFRIRALKVGITTRSLEDRYKWFLRKVFFSARMREIDALLLENAIHQKFRDHVDLRIMKAGMRNGQRWPGDTECYWFRKKESIIEFVRQRLAELEKKAPNYWQEFLKFERADFNVRLVGREKDFKNRPREVMCLDTGERFSSQSEAARKRGISQGNLAMVLRGKRLTAGGSRWVYAEDYDDGTLPRLKPPRTGTNAVNARAVINLETLEEYPTSMEAQRITGVSGSHITSVCRGRRNTAGGARWAYIEDYRRLMEQA